MRHTPPLALVALLLVGASVTGTAIAIDPGEDVTVTGTVTGVDGTPASDAVVLIGDDAMLTKLSPDELRDIAVDDPQKLTVVEVDGEGHFEATPESLRAEAAVAVSEDGISDLTYIRGRDATLEMQLYERRPQTVHVHLGGVAADERRAEMFVNLVNSGDTTVENLSVSVVSLPDGWSIDEVETDGAYHSDNRTLTWPSVPPGADVDTSVFLTVPEGTPVGNYTVEVRAQSDTHLVSAGRETVEVLPEDTPGPTKTSLPAGDEGSETNTGSPTERPTGTRPSPTDESGAGFGAVVVVTALTLAAALLVRRR